MTPKYFSNIYWKILSGNATLAQFTHSQVQPNKWNFYFCGLAVGHCLFSKKKLEKPAIMKTIVDEDGKEVGKKKRTVPMITLIDTEDRLTVVAMDDAEKLAKRRDLKLVRLHDCNSKTKRPVYQLMTGADILKADRHKKEKARDNVKSEKLLSLSSDIEGHDLQAKLRHVSKWIDKGSIVKVVISGATPERIFASVEQDLKETARIINKIQKPGDIRFQILPQKKLNNSKCEEDLKTT